MEKGKIDEFKTLARMREKGTSIVYINTIICGSNASKYIAFSNPLKESMQTNSVAPSKKYVVVQLSNALSTISAHAFHCKIIVF